MHDTSTLPSTQETLRTAVLEAELLLSFAASHGIKLEDSVLNAIVQGQNLLEDGGLPQAQNKEQQAEQGAEQDKEHGKEHGKEHSKEYHEQEIVFWKARCELARAVHPVTAESLKQCVLPKPAPAWRRGWLGRWFGRDAGTGTGVEAVIRKMQKTILLPVLILLVVQVYSLIGQEVVKDLIPRMEKMHEYLSERQKLQLAEKNNPGKEALSTLDSQIRLSQIEIEIRVLMLEKWNSGWVWIALPFQMAVPERELPSVRIDVVNDDVRHRQFRALVQQAEFAIQILQNFILPLLYGCLGAALFVLRSLAADVREYTFDMERKIGYSLRIYMGTLCGLVIGWLVPDAKVHEAGMTQYALSILGGYSVDIVFGLMDKIILSLSGSAGEVGRKTLRKEEGKRT